MKYLFFSDPGHGWLKVPLRTLQTLGIAGKVTRYSHQRGGYAYLEEDCDAPLFIEAMEQRGVKVEFAEHIANRNSRIRSYPPYAFGTLRAGSP